MSKFYYEKCNTTIADFVRHLTVLCENEIDEFYHEKFLGRIGHLFKNKAIVYLVDRYINLWHTAREYDEFTSDNEDVQKYYKKCASEAYQEAHDLAWIIADMLA